MASMNIIQAVNDALHLAMRADERVVLLGEDVGKFGGVFRATVGLQEAFGDDRVIDTPLAESGIKDAEAIVWFGMAAPAKTPRALIDKLNRESNRVLGLPDVKKRFDELGLEIQGGTPEEFQKFIRNEVERLNRLINMGALTRE